MQEPTNLKQLISDLKTEPKEEAPSIPMVDRRSPEQRRLDFLNDLDALVARDRMISIFTERHMPDGRVVGTVEWFPYTKQENASDPPQ